MATITRQQIALIHVARHQLRLSEENYRALLSSFGVDSSKDLSRNQFNDLMQAFYKLGFAGNQRNNKKRSGKTQTVVKPLPGWASAPLSQQAPLASALPSHQMPAAAKKTGSPHTWLTDKQRAKILFLWDEVSRVDEGNKLQALNTMCHRITRIHTIDWLSVGAAQKLIVALERMNEQKAGSGGTDKKAT